MAKRHPQSLTPNQQFFEQALSTDNPDEIYRMRDVNTTQFLIKMAALGDSAQFGFETARGVKYLVASTPSGNYWFMFDVEGHNLEPFQVL